MTVYRWSEISGEFRDALIVGNGASIAVHPGFSYKSLLEIAREEGYVDGALGDLFDRFDTTDFELLLRHLWHAQIVNEALGLVAEPVTRSYSVVREALVQAVRSIHCEHRAAEPMLSHIGKFMSHFKTVISLNYDLIVYWALLRHNDMNVEHQFKDCFIGGTFQDEWERMRQPIYRQRSVTLVCYPHGALHLVVSREGTDLKLSINDRRSFLETIFSEWQDGEKLPLIVCEGSSEQKLRTIRASGYLSTVLNEIIPSSGPTLTIYGWSIGDQEEHILRQIARGGFKKAAVSVFMPDGASAEGFMLDAKRKLRGAGLEKVVFFDASSEGCWATPET